MSLVHSFAGWVLLPALWFLRWQLKHWLGQSQASWVRLWQGIFFTV